MKIFYAWYRYIIYVFEEKNSGDFTDTAFNVFKPMKILESWPTIVFWGSGG